VSGVLDSALKNAALGFLPTLVLSALSFKIDVPTYDVGPTSSRVEARGYADGTILTMALCRICRFVIKEVVCTMALDWRSWLINFFMDVVLHFVF